MIVKSFTSLAPPKDPSLFLGCRGQPLCYLTPYSMQVILLEEMHATSKVNSICVPQFIDKLHCSSL